MFVTIEIGKISCMVFFGIRHVVFVGVCCDDLMYKLISYYQIDITCRFVA